LGEPIAIGEKQNLSVNLIQSQINPVYQLELNSGKVWELNLLNPDIKSLQLNQIEQKSGQIDSISTDIEIGSVKFELELKSEDIETEMTLLSESGFSVKIQKEFQIQELKPKIQPVISFKKSLNWFQKYSENKSKEKNFSLQQAMKFGVPRRIKLNSPYLKSLKIDQSARINQEREITDSSKDIEDLTKSLNSLINSQFGTKKTTFSLAGDLEEISAKLKFPVPGTLNDEWELEVKTNLPEVMVDGEDLRDEMESTLSVQYGIDINNATKLEMESSYNLKTKDYKIILMILIE
ncbi:MAG: hypothetical protein AB4372_19055, partial [Xenococcus sp. (in: cyanobacteria)]